MKIVSACLAGEPCRYDGSAKPCKKVIELVKHGKAIPVCPELLGGFDTPRDAAEQREGKVYTCHGEDVTMRFQKGAYQVLKIAKQNNCTEAILKSKSPSCGSCEVYDGTFSGTLIERDGECTKLLKQHGIDVITEDNLV